MKRILIIDDEENIRELLYVNLVSEEKEVETAVTGEEGLEKMAAFRPEIIIVDGRLPGIDGWEVCRRIRKSPAGINIKVIFLTASAQKTQRESALAAGADYFVSKPFDPAEISDIIMKLE